MKSKRPAKWQRPPAQMEPEVTKHLLPHAAELAEALVKQALGGNASALIYAHKLILGDEDPFAEPEPEPTESPLASMSSEDLLELVRLLTEHEKRLKTSESDEPKH